MDTTNLIKMLTSISPFVNIGIGLLGSFAALMSVWATLKVAQMNKAHIIVTTRKPKFESKLSPMHDYDARLTIPCLLHNVGNSPALDIMLSFRFCWEEKRVKRGGGIFVPEALRALRWRFMKLKHGGTDIYPGFPAISPQGSFEITVSIDPPPEARFEKSQIDGVIKVDVRYLSPHGASRIKRSCFIWIINRKGLSSDDEKRFEAISYVRPML